MRHVGYVERRGYASRCNALVVINETQLVIDSGAQRPNVLRESFGAVVVPITVVLDGEPFLEDVELTRDVFYERLAAGAQVTTAAPAPGQLLEAYEAAAKSGASAVLSVHLDGAMSGTINAARVAADMSPIPVHILDTRTTGWGVDACVETAAEALLSGCDIASAIDAATLVRGRQFNVFVVGQPALLERGGREHVLGRTLEATSLWATTPEGMVEVAKIEDVEQMVAATVAFLVEQVGDRPVRIAVGDARSPDVADQVAAALSAAATVDEIVRYEIAPSLAAHLGAGTVAATFFTRH